MPSLLIQTNVALTEAAKSAVLQQASRVVSEQTGKPESFVLVSLRQCDMMFGGTTDPCAYVFLASLGALGGSTNPSITKALSAILERECGIIAKRIYVQFDDVADRNAFGWNGTTFG